MKKRILTIFLVIVSLFLFGCKEFKFGDDKFYLEYIYEGGESSTWYSFYKKIDKDMIMEPLSDAQPDGYKLEGKFHIMGFWGSIGIFDKEKSPYICAAFCCFYKVGMGKEVSEIYFNYTVASTGERKEEVWEVDFGQKPFEDKRK